MTKNQQKKYLQFETLSQFIITSFEPNKNLEHQVEMILKPTNFQYQIESSNTKGWLDKHEPKKFAVMLSTANLLAEETLEGKIQENEEMVCQFDR